MLTCVQEKHLIEENFPIAEPAMKGLEEGRIKLIRSVHMTSRIKEITFETYKHCIVFFRPLPDRVGIRKK